MNGALDLAGARLCAGPASDPGFTLEVERLSLPAGTLCALVGPTGGGKSTLLEFLALLRQPAALARLAIGARDLTAPVAQGALSGLARLRAGPVGFVPQSGAVLPFLTARGHARLGLDLDEESAGPLAERFAWLAATLGLADHMGKRRAQLSGGQRKRVALLRGFAVPREVLLLDEPTSGLDPEMAATAISVARELCRNDGTVGLAAMHDLSLADRFGLPRVTVHLDDPAFARVEGLG